MGALSPSLHALHALDVTTWAAWHALDVTAWAAWRYCARRRTGTGNAMAQDARDARRARQRAAYELGARAREDAAQRRQAESAGDDGEPPAPWRIDPPQLDPDALSDDERAALERARRRLGIDTAQD